MPPVVVALAGAAATAGVSAAFGVGATILGSTFAVSAVASIAGGIVSMGVGVLLGVGKGKAAPDRSDTISDSGIQQLIRGSIETQRIIYGRQRVSGVVAFIGTSAKAEKENAYLHIVAVLAGHEIQAIENIFINDIEVEIVDNIAVGQPWAELQNPYSPGGEGIYATRTFPVVGDVSGRMDILSTTVNGAGQSGSSLSLTANFSSGNAFAGLVAYPYNVNYVIPKQTAVQVGTDVYLTAADVSVPITYYNSGGVNVVQTLTLPLTKPLVSSPANGSSVALYKNQSSLIFCRKYLGTDDQTAVPELIQAFPDRWTLAHKLSKNAYLYCRMEYDANAFPNGIPNIRAVVQGKKVYDPRTGVMAYSNNAALCLRDYIASDMGYNAPSKINEQLFIAAANVCDETVSIAAGGTEKRYTCNTVIDTSNTLNDNAAQLMSALSGLVSYTQGQFYVAAGAYDTPSITIDESWMAGGISLQTKIPRRELFNGVKGVFVDPNNLWQKMSYPVQESAFYKAKDGAELLREIDYPATTSAATCQRLARIALLKARQSISATLICNYKALRLRPLMTVNITNENLGWVQKPFRIMTWRYAQDGKGIEVEVEEEAAANYNWSTSLEQAVDPAPNTQLPSAFFVDAPGAPQITETFEGFLGVLSNTATITWEPSSSAFISGYLVEFKLYNNPDWITLTTTSDTNAQIQNIELGEYEFRVTAINQIGQRSLPASTKYTISGNTAPPESITNFFVNEIGGAAHLSWDQSPDIDVKLGGRIRLRYSQAVPGTWAEAVDISPALPGVATSAVVPLLAGTYLIKAIDASGRESINAAAITTTLSNILNMNTIYTLQESPSFAGVKTGFAVDTGNLVLDGTTLFNSVSGNFDEQAGLFDAGGGTSNYVSFASYLFSTTTDLGAVYTSRVLISLRMTISNTAALLFDKKEGLFDDSSGLFDGEDITGINAYVYVRTTNDNPSGSPVWSSWRKFIVGDYTARGYQFKLEVESTNNALNISVSNLAVEIDVPDRLEQNKNVVLSASGTTITYTRPFFVDPAISVTVQNAATGDYAVITAKSLTGFTVRVYNSAGVGIARTIDWIARAY